MQKIPACKKIAQVFSDFVPTFEFSKGKLLGYQVNNSQWTVEVKGVPEVGLDIWRPGGWGCGVLGAGEPALLLGQQLLLRQAQERVLQRVVSD